MARDQNQNRVVPFPEGFCGRGGKKKEHRILLREVLEKEGSGKLDIKNFIDAKGSQ